MMEVNRDSSQVNAPRVGTPIAQKNKVFVKDFFRK